MTTNVDKILKLSRTCWGGPFERYPICGGYMYIAMLFITIAPGQNNYKNRHTTPWQSKAAVAAPPGGASCGARRRR